MSSGSSDRCLCRTVHVRTATIVLGFLSIAIGVCTISVAFYTYLHAGTWVYYLLTGAVIFTIGACTIYGTLRYRPRFINPLLAFYIISFTALFAAFVVDILFTVCPLLLSEDLSPSEIPTLRMLGVIGLTMLTICGIFNAWLLHVTFRCLNYLEKKKDSFEHVGF
uniref:MARVEL domain-containing protein n=1 Tax=Steinernema glaseri TaxID=37863 RepID=A0A1I7YTG6_9BILA